MNQYISELLCFCKKKSRAVGVEFGFSLCTSWQNLKFNCVWSFSGYLTIYLGMTTLLFKTVDDQDSYQSKRIFFLNFLVSHSRHFSIDLNSIKIFFFPFLQVFPPFSNPPTPNLDPYFRNWSSLCGDNKWFMSTSLITPTARHFHFPRLLLVPVDNRWYRNNKLFKLTYSLRFESALDVWNRKLLLKILDLV